MDTYDHLFPIKTLNRLTRSTTSIALVADRAASDKETINHQLQTALNSRVVIEQAKGVLAQLGNLDMEASFNVLRRYARDHNQRMSDVARAVATRELPGEQILQHAAATKARTGRHALRTRGNDGT